MAAQPTKRKKALDQLVDEELEGLVHGMGEVTSAAAVAAEVIWDMANAEANSRSKKEGVDG